MLKLLFNLRHQAISLTNPGAIVATDSKNYLVAKFNMLSDDWDMPLSAIFTNAKDSIAYTILVGQEAELEDNECYVPWEVLTTSGDVYVSVFCGSLHTTNTAVFHVVKSGYTEGEIPPPPTPTIYEQMLRMIEEIREAKQNKLTAGENITITEDDVISAVAGIDEAKVLEILDNTLSGNLEATPSLLIDNVVNETYNPNGDLIMYYIDSDDVRHNIFNFTPYLGTKNYNALQNRPVVTGSNVSTSISRELEGVLNFESNSFLVSAYQAPDQIDIGLSPSVPICKTTSNDGAGRYDFHTISGVFANSGTFRVSANKTLNKPSALNDIVQELYITHIATIADEADLIRYVTGKTANGTIVNYIQTAILFKLGAFRFDVIYQSEWQKIGAKVSSAVVNQNGTITFTLDDGSTFTTTGSSVIGPPGQAGSDYILTAQDKSDIADLVLAELPTTQGVQYGNTGN